MNNLQNIVSGIIEQVKLRPSISMLELYHLKLIPNMQAFILYQYTAFA